MKRYVGTALPCTLVIVIASMWVPGNIPSMVCIVPQVLLMLYAVRHFQAGELTNHADNVSALESNWKAFGISLAVVMLLFATVMAARLIADRLFGPPM